MSITSLTYRLTADTSQLGRELRFAERDVRRFQRRAESDIRKLGKAFATMGGLAATALVATAREGVNMAADMDVAARETGTTTEELSALKFAAREVDIEFGTLRNRMERYNRQILDASQGTGDLNDVLEDQDIALRGSNDQIRSQSDLMLDLAEATENAEDHTAQLEIAQAAFGRRGGAEMLKLLREGPEALEDNIEAAEELGLTIDTQTAQAAQRFQAEWRRLTDVGRAFSVTLAADVAPQLAAFTEGLANSAQRSRETSQEIITLESTVTRILASIELMRVGFVAVGNTLGFVGAVTVDVLGSVLGEIRILGTAVIGVGQEMLDAYLSIGDLMVTAVTDPVEAARRVMDGEVQQTVGGALDGIHQKFLVAKADLNSSDDDLRESLKAGWEGYQGDITSLAEEANENILRIQNSTQAEIEREPLEPLAGVETSTQKAADEADQEMQRIVTSIERLRSQAATPLEQFTDGIVDLQAAFEAGIIDEAEFDRLESLLTEQHDPFREIEAANLIAELEGIDLALQAQIESYDELHELGLITAEQHAQAVEMARDEIDEMTGTIEASTEETVTLLDEMGEQAAHEIAGAFADTLFDPFDASLRGMATNFADTMARMATEAAAADIVGGLFSGGGEVSSVPGFAGGGPVSGPGTATSDSILARLSDGEYVIDAATTSHYGADYFRAHQLGKVPRFAEGGPVGTPSTSAPASGGVHIAVVDSRQSAQDYLRSKDGEKRVIEINEGSRSRR